MYSFHCFVCHRVSVNPALIGETSYSVQRSGSSTLTDARNMEILRGRRSLNSVLSSDEVNTVLLRSLVAPLHPFGVGHLIHSIVWPALMAAEEAARMVGSRVTQNVSECTGKMSVDLAVRYDATEEGGAEDMAELQKAASALDRAMDKARKMIMALEVYEASNSVSKE